MYRGVPAFLCLSDEIAESGFSTCVMIVIFQDRGGGFHSEDIYLWCRQGYTVQELYEAIAPEEVVHGTSGALPVAADTAAESQQANKLLFGQWLSIVYMTYAQVSHFDVDT